MTQLHDLHQESHQESYDPLERALIEAMAPETLHSKSTGNTISAGILQDFKAPLYQKGIKRRELTQGHDHDQNNQLNHQLSRSLRGINPNLRFTVHGVLGQGSFGLTWRVMDQDLNRPVAVKTFKGTSDQAVKACKDEVKFLGRLDHPAIPTVYDVGITELGQPFVVMKLLEGESLSEIINRLCQGDPATHQRYSFIQRIELVLQLLRILKSVHRQGVIHRDIKPENILVAEDGTLSLLDWGCAVNLSEVQTKSEVCGTPLFMPPEQVLGQGLTPASDLFAASGVAYELLSLSPPGPSDGTIMESLKQIPTYQPPQVDKISHPTQGYPPSEFYPVIMRGLARDPDERPQSAEEMMLFLRRALEGHIEVVCPRTFIKAHIGRFTRWMDHNPYRVIPTVVLSLIGLTLIMISLGVFIGALLF